MRRPGKGGGSPAGLVGRRVCFVTHAPTESLSSIPRETITSASKALEKRGWRTDLRVVDFQHAKRPHKSWDALLPPAPEIPLVALYGQPALGEWALQRGRRIGLVEGSTGDLPIFMTAVRSVWMVDEALRRLIVLGHRHVVVPLRERRRSFETAIRKAVRGNLELAGTTYVESIHTRSSGYKTTRRAT